MNRKLNIVIADYNLGNTYSVSNAIKHLGYNVRISSEESNLKNADVIILPGVGAFEEAIKNIKSRNLDKILGELVLVKSKPILGICVGMQLLANSSEENGLHEGLGWIEGHVKQIIPLNNDKVPHVGWNNIIITKESKLYTNLGQDNHFYFDHKYHFVTEEKFISAQCEFGNQLITSSVQYRNIFGVQFHPEKSQRAGLKLFRGFLENVELI